jgi:anti-sigma factor RsiW
MSERDDIRDIHLSALIDGELGDERRTELERTLKADASLAARFSGMQADKEMLRRVYEPVARRPLPKEWLAIAYGSRPQTPWRLIGSIAAALLVAVISTVSYFELRPHAPAGIVEEALNARQDATRPDRIIAVAEDGDVARYDGMLRQAVGARVRVPDMRKAGYRLASIRVFPHDGGRATELAYRDARNHIFTLYVSRSDGSVDFVQFERRGLRVCLWRDDAISTVMAGNVSTAAMQRLAVLAYAGMTA